MEKRKRNIKILSPRRQKYLHIRGDGQIRISSQLASDMGIQDGDRVSLFVEDSEGFQLPEIYIAKNPCGFKVKLVTFANKSGEARACRFYSKDLTAAFLKDTGRNSMHLNVGDKFVYEGTEYFTIIHYASDNIQGLDKIAIGCDIL